MELPFLSVIGHSVSSEQKRNAPQTRQTNYGVNQSAEQGTCPAEEPGNQIELENADEAPVQTTDD